MSANLNYPIIVEFYNNQYEIIDGYHRFVKSFLQENEYIYAYIFNRSLLRKFFIHNNTGFETDKFENTAILEYLQKSLLL